MAEDLIPREKNRLLDVARDYERAGYEVLVAPRASELPAFLRGLHLDMIATAPEDKVVVEVKTRSTMAGDKRLERIARRVERNKQWRFELVLTNPRHYPNRDLPADAPLSEREIARRFKSAKSLATSRDYASALLLLWSAAEAILRQMAHNQDLPPSVRVDPRRLIKELRSRGALTADEYRHLRHAFQIRSRVAHGLSIPTQKASNYHAFVRLARMLGRRAEIGLPQ